MAKSKIIWSNRAKKRLYGLFEFHISNNKSKTYLKNLWDLIANEILSFKKHPDLGLKTSKENIRGLLLDDHIIYYQITENKILIHTIAHKG